MQHLYTMYGTVIPDMLKDNLKLLSTPWNPTDPIMHLWKQVQDCRAFAKKGGDEISEETTIRIVIEILDASEVFPMDMHAWLSKPDNIQSNYSQLKVHFNRADRLLKLKATSKSAGYAGAAITPYKKPPPAETQTTKTPPAENQHKNKKAKIEPMDVGPLRYCWTHGFNLSHTGQECKVKDGSHNKNATVKNMQGGNNMVQRRKGEKRIYIPPENDTSNKKMKKEEED